ncbi:unnamed protein product [Oncorhynchus mykiss]|uniref:Receptor ligand binding region domain-containing protein n=1 Tax=Oncorhynchus mykiss TaxID=8022 RepID=A0A060WEE4_ONCMY|nr:unnamed protein product [Oncorhynchus mykiss]
MNNRKDLATMRAFDMAFVIGQKSNEGYDYYDFFEQVSPYSAYLHDAVLLYAMGLKEVLKDGKDPHDGSELLQRLKNKNNIHFYDISLVILLVVSPLIGVSALVFIGLLMLQKFRLQTRLDGSCWCIINYNEITIIKEPKGVPALSMSTTASKTGSRGSYQTILSSTSYGLRDNAGKEHIYSTIGLFQVYIDRIQSIYSTAG